MKKLKLVLLPLYNEPTDVHTDYTVGDFLNIRIW